MLSNRNEPLEIFCWYAREDQKMLYQLRKCLSPLERDSRIILWSDTDLNAGVEWERALHHHLESAHIILLLISPDFMASDYCYSVEMKRAIERHDEGSAVVIPVLLRSVHWEDGPFAKLQVVPTNAVPVNHWPDPDDAFLDITKRIREVSRLLARAMSPPVASEPVSLLPPGYRGVMRYPFLTGLLALPTGLAASFISFIGYLRKQSLLAFYRSSIAVCRVCGFNIVVSRASEHALLLEQDPCHRSHLYLQKGHALLRLQRSPEALEAYSAAIRLDPNLSQAYQARGEVYEHLAQQCYDESQKRARDAYKKAEELEAKSPSKHSGGY